MPRNTTTGGVLEAMVLPALERGGYTHEEQVNVGFRPSGGRHMLDTAAHKNGEDFLISLKWQQTSGTAEQKVPYEVICLIEIILDPANNFNKGYIVLGGTGWTLRDYYTSGGLEKHLAHANKVEIVTLEEFVGRANNGKL